MRQYGKENIVEIIELLIRNGYIQKYNCEISSI